VDALFLLLYNFSLRSRMCHQKGQKLNDLIRYLCVLLRLICWGHNQVLVYAVEVNLLGTVPCKARTVV
jgi:hypothetical protein